MFTFVQESFSTSLHLWRLPKGGILELEMLGQSIFFFLIFATYCQAVFWTVFTNLEFH